MTFDINLKPRPEREATIKKALESSPRKHRIDEFRGEAADLDVVQLEIGLPIYRMANCRTYSEQQDIIAKKDLEIDFFIKGQESSSAQSEQHEILRGITKHAKGSVANIDDELAKDGQTRPLILTHTGIVVNGNRRLSAMRDLFESDRVKFKSFANVWCAILPADASADDIDDVEAAEQGRPQTKLDYDWIGDAELARRHLAKKKTFDQVADLFRRRPVDIKNLLQALEEAELYLSEWCGKPRQYSLVREDGEQIFKDIAKQIAAQEPELQNASRAIAWTLFDNRKDLSGRVYGYNPAFGKLASTVVDTVVEELGLELGTIESVDDQFEFAIEEDEGALDYEPFIEALRNPETKEEATQILIGVSSSEIEKDKNKKRKDAALKSLTLIHSKLAAIDLSIAGQNTYDAMLSQITSIDTLLGKLKGDVEQAIDAKKLGADE